jgi:hypothetical protein
MRYARSVDVEKTIEFILEHQARAEVSHARTEAALARMAERQDNTEALLRRAIRAGVEEARRQRVRSRRLDEKIAAGQRQTDEEITRLAAAQRQTEASLKAFIDSMNRGGNGRH